MRNKKITSNTMHQINVNGLVVDVVRKNIKNLHLGVYPPEGRVRVAAPLRVNDEAVRLAIISKLSWIKRQQSKFQTQNRQSAREYVYRESHYYLGHRYLLNVVYHKGPGKVIIRNKSVIDLYVREDADEAQREKVLVEWYRRELKKQIPPLIQKWEQIIGVKVNSWGVKKMKTKWGSCTPEAGRIWLNLELIKKSSNCLEYILVHEMMHLLERKHNDHFKELMDFYMPHWRLYRDELNRMPLAHETWTY
ncbi:M48 family metallopeptidase [Methanolobus sp. WCC5]|uniref:M48 family metallopeptidase n=1 Tax=Methanolobus sp. WCC5 TaxID=3125785 RepID=UPI003253D982